jgi:ATP-binding cassette subfamily B protein
LASLKLKFESRVERFSLGELRRVYSFFGGHIRPYYRRLAVALLCTFGAIAMNLLRPWPIKVVFDYILLPKTTPLRMGPFELPFDILHWPKLTILGATCVAIVAIALLSGIFNYFQTWLIASSGQGVVFSIRRRLFGHLQKLSLSFHDRSRSGDLLMRLTGDINMLKEMLIASVLTFISSFLVLGGMIAIMFWMDRGLTLAALSVVPLLSLAVFRISGEIKQASRKQRKKESALATMAHEAVSSIKVVQSFARQEIENLRFKKYSQKSYKTGLKATRLEAQLYRVVEIILALGTCLVIWYGVRRVLSGALTPGDLIVFMAYVRQMYRPVRNISKLTKRVAKALACGERVIEVLGVRPQIRDSKDAIEAPRFAGDVSLKNVTFSYEPGKPALRNVSFKVKRGEFVAIVGPTGAGKSSIVNLLLRLYDPQEGKVRIDGENIRRYKLDSLREQIGIVFQEPILFGLSVRDNIAYGKPNASLEEVVRAAKLANGHEFIEELPDGYETVLGERGVTLSGGQRQRIAIARAVIKDPPILVLDEPSIGLDAETESKVNEALSRLTSGKTIFVIAHKLSSVHRADRILVMDHGQLVASGKHLELMKKSALYDRLYRMQFVDEELKAPAGHPFTPSS